MARRSLASKPPARAPVMSYQSTQLYDITSIRYNTPELQDMAVIMAFFNPAKSFRIIQNLYTIKQLLEMSGIPVYIGEIAFNDAPFVLPPSSTTYQYRTSSIMFYKENIMTQVLKHVPETFTKVVLLDADILFVDPEWYRKLSDALNTYDVVHPYCIAHRLNISFQVNNTDFSVLAGGNSPGFAWAFRRSWLQTHPLFEYALVGGGDTMVYLSLSNYAKYTSTLKLYKPDIPKLTSAPPSASYVDLEILHLPHGSLTNRQYGSRYERIESIMSTHNISALSQAVYRTHDGIFEWKPEYRDAMNVALLDYFTKRNDDGI